MSDPFVDTIKTQAFAAWSHPSTARSKSLEVECADEEDGEDDDTDTAEDDSCLEDMTIDLPALLPLAGAESIFQSITTVDYSAARKASNEDREKIQGGMEMQVCDAFLCYYISSSISIYYLY